MKPFLVYLILSSALSSFSLTIVPIGDSLSYGVSNEADYFSKTVPSTGFRHPSIRDPNNGHAWDENKRRQNNSGQFVNFDLISNQGWRGYLKDLLSRHLCTQESINFSGNWQQSPTAHFGYPGLQSSDLLELLNSSRAQRFGGANVGKINEQLEQINQKTIITYLVGINDIFNNKSIENIIDDLKINIKKIERSLENNNSSKSIIILTLPLLGPQHEQHNQSIKDFNNELRWENFQQETNMTIHLLDLENLNRDFNGQVDDIHFSDFENRQVAMKIYNKISALKGCSF